MISNIKNRFVLIFSFLSLCVMGFIFYNSLQGSVASNAISTQISEEIQTVVDPNQKMKSWFFHIIIRKLAHGVEFCALGVSLGALMYSIQRAEQKKCRIFMILFLSLAIAVTDEYIQSFTGRTSMVEDIIIDFSGAICGIILVSLALIIINKIQRHITRKKG